MRGVDMLLLALAPAFATAAERCEMLAELKLPDTTITSAERIAAAPMAGAASALATPEPPKLPAHCRVIAVIRPAADSNIRIEAWMPEAGWNGKFLGVGNGGWAGQIPRAAMVSPLLEGYATASTDTGHEGAGADFALEHPEKLIDYSYRAVHEMTVKAKAVISRYYGKGPRFSYWAGCSLGGQQALKEAQLYPADYDGISAGCPTYNRTHLHAWQLYVGQEALQSREPKSLSQDKLEMLHAAVLDACDLLDGVKDGILNDPRQCTFDPAALRCRGGETPDCLTDAQVKMVGEMYAPAFEPATGNKLYPGAAYGSELAWKALIGGPEPFGLAVGMFQYLVRQNRNWNWRSFDVGRDTGSADRQYRDTLNAEKTDLNAFRSRGGKLLLWHGWSDALVPPQGTIDYYRAVEMASGNTRDFVRLFLVPGMFHCRGGAGPNQFNAIAALERWVESGAPPDQLIAYHVTGNLVDITRPLCAYPQVARWRGIGSTNDASNFVCGSADAPRSQNTAK